jgi:hypothetical protein
MNLPQDEFEKAAKLISWKRHEQPPPGYFHFFSHQVISRIEAEERESQFSWWERLLARFDAKPILAGTYAVAVTGLLVAGFRVSSLLEHESASFPDVNGGWLAASPMGAPLLGQGGSLRHVIDTPTPAFSSSVHPVAYGNSGLFGINASYQTAQFNP